VSEIIDLAEVERARRLMTEDHAGWRNALKEVTACDKLNVGGTRQCWWRSCMCM